MQIGMLFVVKNLSWPITLLVAYVFGGVLNHSLMLGEWNFVLLSAVYFVLKMEPFR